MVKYVEVPLKSVSDRLDVGYYLVLSEARDRYDVDKGTPLTGLGARIRTRTPPREVYSEEGTPCIKLRNVTGQFLNATNCDFVPARLQAKFVTAKKYDIIITATGEGTAGRCDIFLKDQPYIVTGENILFRPRLDRINPFYLLSVLRSKPVRNQLTQLVRGATGQTHLYWNDIASIRVPLADRPSQKECERLYLEAWKRRQQAAAHIQTAKAAITGAVRAEKVDLKARDLVFEIHSTQTKSPLRFDVEYYQPIHERTLEKLRRAGAVQVQTLADLNEKTVNPRTRPTSRFHYIDISSVDIELGDYVPTTVLGHEAPTRARRKPRKGDVIVSTVRPARNAVALITDEPSNLLVSTGFCVLSPVKVKTLVLFAMLKTEIVFSQIARKATAAMYPAVTEKDVLDTWVPSLPASMSDEVERQVGASASLRRQADRLLAEFEALGEKAFELLLVR